MHVSQGIHSFELMGVFYKPGWHENYCSGKNQMIIDIDFDLINKFDCTYGEIDESEGGLRVFVKGGAALPQGSISRRNSEVGVFDFFEGKGEGAEKLFPKHYIYDSSKGVEYVEWYLEDGIVRGRTSSGEWTKYTSKADSLYAMHEYVGGFWFVFEGVVFCRRAFDEYASGGQVSVADRLVHESGNASEVSSAFNKYILEGVLEFPAVSGWMFLEVFARKFYIYIPSEGD